MRRALAAASGLLALWARILWLFLLRVVGSDAPAREEPWRPPGQSPGCSPACSDDDDEEADEEPPVAPVFAFVPAAPAPAPAPVAAQAPPTPPRYLYPPPPPPQRLRARRPPPGMPATPASLEIWPEPEPHPEPTKKRPSTHATPDSKRPRARGLYNPGNTCFVNALLQALAVLDPFCDALATAVARGGLATQRAGGWLDVWGRRATPADAAVELLRVLQAVRAGGGGPVSAAGLLRVAAELSPLVASMALAQRQEDAGEFLLTLLAWVDEAQSAEPNPEPKADVESLRLALALGADAGDPESYLAALGELARAAEPPGGSPSPFEGLLVRGTLCSACGALSARHQPLRLLAVPVACAAAAPAVSLAAAVRAQFEAETVPAVECSACGQRATGRSQPLFQRPPRLLAVQLSRFGMDAAGAPVKLRARVALADEPLACAPLTLDAAPGHYELRAVVCHWGAHVGSGHYVAYCRSCSGSWVRLDDERAAAVSWGEVAAAAERDAYLVFYLLVDAA